ncbi:hypothetical protein [Streptomyces sp. 3214.6]|uniref:hypothetical protein n=1 Tax=Streptomyces sp. 3214.6 TaxID=1882757 RepID=UPI0015D53BC2|nr:hypothetical protein [Streptomyces sp. 3214.6]
MEEDRRPLRADALASGPTPTSTPYASSPAPTPARPGAGLQATRLGAPASDEAAKYRLQLAEIRVV